MNWFEYWIGHCWMTGWQTIASAFKMWVDLMTDNYDDYVLLKDDDPFTECYLWFWVTLGEDNTYPKEFLLELQDLCDRVTNGQEELIPVTLEEINSICELLEDS